MYFLAFSILDFCLIKYSASKQTYTNKLLEKNVIQSLLLWVEEYGKMKQLDIETIWAVPNCICYISVE